MEENAVPTTPGATPGADSAQFLAAADWVKQSTVFTAVTKDKGKVELSHLATIAADLKRLAEPSEGWCGTTPEVVASVLHEMFADTNVKGAVPAALTGGKSPKPLGAWDPVPDVQEARREDAFYLWKEAKGAVMSAPEDDDGPVMVPWLGPQLDRVVRLLDTPELTKVVVGADTLQMNDMTSKPEADRKAIDDVDDFVTTIRVAVAEKLRGEKLVLGKKKTRRMEISVSLPKATVYEALLHVAKRHRYHPVREYLGSFSWDGVPRIHSFLEKTFRMTWEDPAERQLHQKYIRWWFIQAVSRIFQPGCKADYMLTFAGAQGRRKSALLRKLVPDERWFHDQVGDISDKDAVDQLYNAWIIEWSELANLNKKEAEETKSFLSRQDDTYRAPYALDDVTRLRTFVFGATTNRFDFLRDFTGNRRYWIIPTHDAVADVEFVAANRDQLWAEAVAAYRAGESAYPSLEEEALINAYNDQFILNPISSGLESIITAWAVENIKEPLSESDGVNSLRVRFDEELRDTNDRDRRAIIAAVLTRIGLAKLQWRVGNGVRVRGYWARPEQLERIKRSFRERVAAANAATGPLEAPSRSPSVHEAPKDIEPEHAPTDLEDDM